MPDTPRPGHDTIAALAAATPDDRDRVVDLLRAAALCVVALGHWLLAVVRVGPDGGLTGDNALALVPALQPVTWLFQVMPLFFIVGGYANARSWASAERRGAGRAEWMTGRLQRLLRPTAVFVAVWAVAAVLLGLSDVPAPTVALAAHLVAVPLWFLAVYVPLVALAPTMLALHRRFGLAVPVALTAAAAAVDVLHRGGVPLVGWTNFALVWLVPQQLGFVWTSTRLRRHAPLLAATGLGALILLSSVGPYPVSLVGVPGAAASNNAPPTVMLIALSVLQLGLALWVHPLLTRWLRRPAVWRAVILANARAMTVYLWHLTALVLVAVAVVRPGFFPDAAPGTVAWWLLRPAWLAVLLVALVPLVVVAGPVEQGQGRARVTAPRVAIAALATSAGAAWLATVGIGGRGTAGVLAMVAAAVLIGAWGGRTPSQQGPGTSTSNSQVTIADASTSGVCCGTMDDGPLASAR